MLIESLKLLKKHQPDLTKGLFIVDGEAVEEPDDIYDSFSLILLPHAGICYNMGEIYSHKYHVDSPHTEAKYALMALFQLWPGIHWNHQEYKYPVSGPEEFCGEATNMWTNPRRVELLDWLIEVLS